MLWFEKFQVFWTGPCVHVRVLVSLKKPLLLPSVQYTRAPEELVTIVVLVSVRAVTLELELQLRMLSGWA